MNGISALSPGFSVHVAPTLPVSEPPSSLAGSFSDRATAHQNRSSCEPPPAFHPRHTKLSLHGVASVIDPCLRESCRPPVAERKRPRRPPPRRASFLRFRPSPSPTTFVRLPTTENVTRRPLRFRKRYMSTAAGMLESSSFSGMKGLKASRLTSSGTSGSRNRTSAIGNSPRNETSLNLGSPAPVSHRTDECPPVFHLPPAGPSITFTSGAFPGRSTRSAKNANGIRNPFAGRFITSQSRSCPHPPRLTHPVPIPPSGNAISARSSPVRAGCGPRAYSSAREYGTALLAATCLLLRPRHETPRPVHFRSRSDGPARTNEGGRPRNAGRGNVRIPSPAMPTKEYLASW